MFSERNNILSSLQRSVVNTLLIISTALLWPVLLGVIIGEQFIEEQVMVNTDILIAGVLGLSIFSSALLYYFHKTKSLRIGYPIPLMFYVGGVVFLVNDLSGYSLVTYWLLCTLIVVYVAILYGRAAMTIIMGIIIVGTFFIPLRRLGVETSITYISFSPILIVIAVFIDMSMVRLIQALTNLDGVKTELESNLLTIKNQREREKEMTQRLNLVVSNISEAVLLINRDLKIRLINGLGNSYLNKKQGDIFDPNVFIDDRKEIPLTFLEDLFKTGKNFLCTEHLELRLANHNSPLPVELIATPVWNDGKIEYALILIRDVSATREIDKLKSEFVSVASHQMRTPLTAIKWNLENLSELETDRSEQSKEIITTIQDSTTRMIELVNDLLSTSRIDRGDLADLVKAEFNFTELVNEVISQNTSKSESHAVKITFSHPDQDIMYYGDKEKLFEAMSNLISNSIKYTKENTEVNINLHVEHKQLMLEITDYGIGIPEADQPRIFKKFFRAENARKKLAEGNGIGLYVVKSFIEAHEGFVRFTSIENKGTTFYVVLPFKSN